MTASLLEQLRKPRLPGARPRTTPRLRESFAAFTLSYLADYALTLAGTRASGFHETNPLLGPAWNTGDYLTPLLLKLTGLLLVALHLVACGRERRALAHGTLQLATSLFALVNAWSLLQLARL
jgi:hypothetical protein